MDDPAEQTMPDELDGTARQLVEFALTSMLAPALLVDGGGFVEAASPAALATLGQSPDRVIGHHVRVVLGVDEDALEQLAADPLRLDDHVVRRSRLRLRASSLRRARRDGGWLVQFHGELPETDADPAQPQGRADLVARTTARLDDLLDDLLDRHERLDRYVGVISHDLQAPARRLLSLVELLRGDLVSVSDVVDERLVAVEDSAHHLLRLTSELLAFSRLGSTPMPVTIVDTGTVLDATLDQLEVALAESGAEVVVDGRLPAVRADPTFLAVVFQHLLQNAIDHRRSDVPPEIRVEAERLDDRVQIRVIDNGRGIPAELRSAVFRPFRRLSPGAGHTGLGLATVADIVDRFGGEVAVTDGGPGAGSTFTVTLGAADDHEME